MTGRKVVAGALLCGLLAWQFVLVGDSAAKEDKFAEKGPGTTKATSTESHAELTGSAKLTYDASTDTMSLMTPRKMAKVRSHFGFPSGSGNVDINGQQVAVAAVSVPGKKPAFGMDVNGNGSVDPNEFQTLPSASKPLLFKLKLGDKQECVVTVDSIQVSKMQGGGTGVWGKYYAASALKGSIDGVPIRIIDDNLDGKITQDGSDAIVIGRSPFAQPLYRIHQIGASFYEIKVDEDGKGLSFGKVSDLKPVTVKSPLLKLGATKALVVADSDSGQAFDLVAAKSGIPAGTYSLCYGVISAGKDVVVIRPGKETEKVTVSESPSTLTLGAPLKVNFDGRLVGNKVEVFPNLTVVGAGGESYDPDFGSTLSRPSVLLMEGTKVLIRQQMEYG